ncbi:MAG TPA: hypothetical protein VMH78_03310, partial [Thermoplasmata archaeon]|nr:hypothetical protein [Thermoplasmata archaeon]
MTAVEGSAVSGSGARSARRSARSVAGLAIAASLVLAGLVVAIAAGAEPAYHVSTLATSGSFFALAESGDILYTASDNGGSVLLEKSLDRGADWSASPVPYSAVAGGAPWALAAVAADGTHLVLAAATAGSYLGPATWYPPVYNGPPPAGASSAFAPANQTLCGTPSSILVASSPDGGRSWTTTTWETNLTVASLQAAFEGNRTAVAWLGEPVSCNGTAEVGAVTSDDAGVRWSPPQFIANHTGGSAYGTGVEMAPSTAGIVVAFPYSPANATTSELAIFSFAPTAAAGFAPVTTLPAPGSWTLQGDPGTPAYLLTPTYLVPLVSPPYTAIPFNELQRDAGLGSLPRVVSLVPTSGGIVEVAATTSDNLGVDCWQIDPASFAVTQSCHVPLGSFLLPADAMLPIVALIDGGGWWIAIGASGNPTGCVGACPGGYAPSGGYAASASSAVGTSVCLTGCSAVAGLAAYSYAPGATVPRNAAFVVAGALAVTGLALGWFVRRRTRASRRTKTSRTAAPSTPRARLARSYRTSLLVWAIAWLPLAALSFDPAGATLYPAFAGVIVLGAVTGSLLAGAFLFSGRRAVAQAEGFDPARLETAVPAPEPGPGYERVRFASLSAYASWATGLVVLISLTVAINAGPPSSGSALSAAGNAPALAVLVATTAFVGLRALYHASLAGCAVAPDGSETASERWRSGAAVRTWVGATLLPLNPFVGLALGYALDGALGGSPYVLAWAFLATTLTGIAVLAGCFGPTLWSTAPA